MYGTFTPDFEVRVYERGVEVAATAVVQTGGKGGFVLSQIDPTVDKAALVGVVREIAAIMEGAEYESLSFEEVLKTVFPPDEGETGS